MPRPAGGANEIPIADRCSNAGNSTSVGHAVHYGNNLFPRWPRAVLPGMLLAVRGMYQAVLLALRLGLLCFQGLDQRTGRISRQPGNPGRIQRLLLIGSIWQFIHQGQGCGLGFLVGGE